MTTENKIVFFLHIPKNSGTTLNTIIRQNYGRVFKVSWKKSEADHWDNLLLNKGSTNFSNYEVIRGHFPYGLHEALIPGTPYTYFTLLRDPIRRTWSQYHYLLNDSTYILKNPHLRQYLQGLSLAEYCQQDHPDIPNHTFTDNCQVRYLSGIGDRKPFGTIDANDLELAKQNLSKMFFGITEDFDRSMLYLKQALGWKRILYTRQNVGSKTCAPTPEEIELLKACNQFDLQLYAYGLELFRERAASIDDRQLRAYAAQLSRHQIIHHYKNAARGLLKKVLNGFSGRQR
jgi:hypothetical protein